MRYTAFNRHGRQVTVTVPSDQAKASAPIDPITWWGEKGLEYWETGGGCVAFGRNLEDEGNHYVLVTTQDGDAPPVAGESVLVGLYNPDDLSDGVYDSADTFDEALNKLNALIDRHVK